MHKYVKKQIDFNSEEFRKAFRESVEENTWDKRLPKIYLDENENIIEHWKDGTINILKTKEELNDL